MHPCFGICSPPPTQTLPVHLSRCFFTFLFISWYDSILPLHLKFQTNSMQSYSHCARFSLSQNISFLASFSLHGFMQFDFIHCCLPPILPKRTQIQSLNLISFILLHSRDDDFLRHFIFNLVPRAHSRLLRSQLWLPWYCTFLTHLCHTGVLSYRMWSVFTAPETSALPIPPSLKQTAESLQLQYEKEKAQGCIFCLSTAPSLHHYKLFWCSLGNILARSLPLSNDAILPLIYDLSGSPFVVLGKNFPFSFFFCQQMKYQTLALQLEVSFLTEALNETLFKPRWNPRKDSNRLPRTLEETLIRHFIPYSAPG